MSNLDRDIFIMAGLLLGYNYVRNNSYAIDSFEKLAENTYEPIPAQNVVVENVQVGDICDSRTRYNEMIRSCDKRFGQNP